MKFMFLSCKMFFDKMAEILTNVYDLQNFLSKINKMDTMNFFMYKVDPVKDQAIDDFLRTPIDSRSTQVEDNFTLPHTETPLRTKRDIKNTEVTKKQIMSTWNRAITKMSKNAVIPPKPRITSRSALDVHPTLKERTIKIELDRQKDPFEEFENQPETKPIDKSVMPLRKNDIPIGRHYSNNLVLKRTTKKYFKK